MTLRYRTLLNIGTILLFALIVTTVVLRIVLQERFASLEERRVIENVLRVELALENLRIQLASKTTDWAQWDDTYNYMHDFNEAYIKSNISFETLSAISVTHVIYRDINSSLTRGFVVDYQDESVEPLSSEMLASWEILNHTIPGLKPEETKTGIFSIGDQTFIFAAIPVFDSRRDKNCRGSLLFSIALDEKLINSIAEQTRLDVKFLPVSLHLSLLQPSTNKILSRVISDDEIHGYTLVKDIADKPLRVIRVSLTRDIFKQGNQAINLLILAVLGVMCSALAASGFSLNKWVLSRLSGLEKEVCRIDPATLSGGRVYESGSDELTSLASSINSMLTALELTQKDLAIARAIAESANRAKSMFIARVSHELRNPIHGIRGINHLILKQEITKGVQDLIKMGDLAADSLLSIVDEILDFSKAEVGELVFEKVPYNPRQVVRETLQVVAARLEGKYSPGDLERVQLVCEIDISVPEHLEGDPTRLKQVLINLLTNAVKFTQRGFVGLNIAGKKGEGSTELQIKVWDTGIGIPEEKLESLFEPFKQVDETVQRKYQGTGLGLSIVKQFSEGMGGKVWVESILGKGSAFHVLLPQKVVIAEESQLANLARPQTLILAPQSPVWAAIEKGLQQRGVEPNVFALATQTDAQELPAETERAIRETEFFVTAEESLASPKIWELLKQRQENGRKSLAIVRPANLQLRERLYAAGEKLVFSTPILVEDLLLSYSSETPQVAVPGDKPAPDLALDRKLRILIADDVLTNRIILQDLLEEAGHEVVPVSDGEEIIAEMTPLLTGETNSPGFDLIITDVTMPIVNGDEAAKVIRELEGKTPGQKHLPIIAITGHAFGEELASIRAAGIDGILTKPMEPEKLAAELLRLFPRAGAESARA